MSSLKQHIEQWQKQGIITEAQASTMLKDVDDASTLKIISIVATVGALLLGLGVLVFIAANWTIIPDFAKVGLMLAITFGSLIIGYILKYRVQNLSKVGTAILFLSGLLIGATIFLIGQIYNIQANFHGLVLLWLFLLLPLIYGFQSKPLSFLGAILYSLWFVIFMGETMNFGDPHEIFSILILGNMALIGFGALHYFLPSLHSIGRSIRLTGISVGLIFLFILSFFHTEWGVNSVSDDISIFAIVLASLCIILEGFSLFRTHIENKIIEGGLILLLSITMLLNVLNYSVWNYYAVNVEFVAVLVGLFYLGHKRRDMTLVNIGLVWTIAFICGKYFDYFWDLLPKSLYFLIGGALLVGTGFVLEKKRSSLAKHYEAQ